MHPLLSELGGGIWNEAPLDSPPLHKVAREKKDQSTK